MNGGELRGAVGGFSFEAPKSVLEQILSRLEQLENRLSGAEGRAPAARGRGAVLN